MASLPFFRLAEQLDNNLLGRNTLNYTASAGDSAMYNVTSACSQVRRLDSPGATAKIGPMWAHLESPSQKPMLMQPPLEQHTESITYVASTLNCNRCGQMPTCLRHCGKNTFTGARLTHNPSPPPFCAWGPCYDADLSVLYMVRNASVKL